MDTKTFNVTGMTCEHCVAAVSEEVTRLAGVSDVAVDLASGRLVVQGSDLDGAAIGDAVESAGYAAEAC
jgi:copper ion binding protein